MNKKIEGTLIFDLDYIIEKENLPIINNNNNFKIDLKIQKKEKKMKKIFGLIL